MELEKVLEYKKIAWENIFALENSFKCVSVKLHRCFPLSHLYLSCQKRMKGRKKRNIRGWGGTGKPDVLHGFKFYIIHIQDVNSHQRSSVFPLITYMHYCGKVYKIKLRISFPYSFSIFDKSTNDINFSSKCL